MWSWSFTGTASRPPALCNGVDAPRGKVAPEQDPIGVDDIQRPLLDAAAVVVRAVPLTDAALGLEVRQQGEADAAVLGERAVTPHAVNGDAQRDRVRPAGPTGTDPGPGWWAGRSPERVGPGTAVFHR